MLPCISGPERKLFRSVVGLGFVLFFPALGMHAQPTSTQQSPPPTQPATRPPYPAGPTTLSVTAREVLLDIVVTDAAGHPVPGLKASDFTVIEEGEPQVIRHLEEHDPMSAADLAKIGAVPSLPPNTFTNYTPVLNTNASTVILLDAMDTPIIAQEYLRQQLIGYLKHMQPGPQIAIFQLDTDLHLIQSFSSDPQVVLAAAESKRDMPSLARPIAGDRYIYHKDHLELLRDAMRSIGAYLAAFPGRKNLIWFTGNVPLWRDGSGFGNPFHDSFGVIPGSSGDDIADLTDVLTVSRVAVYPVDTRGLLVDSQFTAQNNGRPSQRANLRNFARQANNEANLEDVANATGGKPFFNTNDLRRVIGEVVDNGSSYYTLAYATTNTKWQGQFRHVRITIDRPDLHLQHRNGYYAYNRDQQEQKQIAAIERREAGTAQQPQTPAPLTNPAPENQQSNATPPASDADGALVHRIKGGFDASMALGAVPATEIIFGVSFLPDNQVEKVDKKSPPPQDNFLRPAWQNKPFRNYAVVIHADARRLKLNQSSDGIRHGSVQFVTVVYDQQGAMVNSLQKTVSLDVEPATYRKLLATGLPIREEIAIPVKGNYFLRFGVHDEMGDQVGALEIPADQIRLGVAGIAFRKP